uniref:Olfactory receptor family 5 subfamily P member 2 n=1 Tax=Piliocolobus tephrosceles TaxID=591936 RepID=A0A8C9GBE8_9PRIM
MNSLKNGNRTALTGFILLGLTDDPILRVTLFIIILCIYLVTISGNLGIIILIRISSQLRHPMYFFLSHLAFADMAYSSSVTPNMLVNFLVERNTISYLGCAIQLGSAAFFATVECFLLAAMTYDHFVAICSPLLYSTKMSTQVSVQLFLVAYMASFLIAVSYTTSFYFLLFFVLSFSSGSVIMVTMCVIAISYIYILITILKMRSTEGCHKAFSTCTSHLTAVTVLWDHYIHLCDAQFHYSTDQNKVVSVFYTVVIPMLNPLIYSLRSKEIKGALKRELGRKILS